MPKVGLEENGLIVISTVFSNPSVYNLMSETVVYKTGKSQAKKSGERFLSKLTVGVSLIF
jgi:hypothetical protein